MNTNVVKMLIAVVEVIKINRSECEKIYKFCEKKIILNVVVTYWCSQHQITSFIFNFANEPFSHIAGVRSIQISFKKNQPLLYSTEDFLNLAVINFLSHKNNYDKFMEEANEFILNNI